MKPDLTEAPVQQSIIPFSPFSIFRPFRYSIIPLFLALSASALAQDSARIGIHQQEAELHRWDVLRTHHSVPEFGRGVESAQKGDIKDAIRWFQKGAPGRASMAYFNLGVVYFETQEFEKALRYLKLSYRARKDSVCLDYLQNTERLINKRKQKK
jgi:tetratricopeptide (TPR) repeat protein